MGYKRERKRIKKKWKQQLEKHPNLKPMIETYRGLDLGFLERKFKK